MQSLSAYLPQDRIRALAQGQSLPDRAHGTALFADISGFTSLTESLREVLGPRRGAEELSRRLEAVYTALIAEIERHGGSVIDFAGDSLLCWFDASLGETGDLAYPISPTPLLAAACGLALQRAMRAFARIPLPNQESIALHIKVAITSGPARRFVAGDPSVHLVDMLAGATITRSATAGELTGRGEILIDEDTAAALGAGAVLGEWRSNPAGTQRFAVLSGLTTLVETPLAMPAMHAYLSAQDLLPWLFPALVEREQTGQADFLTEFRPCATLFMRFTGIDYDDENAGARLDAFIRLAEQIVSRHDGTLLQAISGDKGSYAYINFGVLKTHEDDERRAVMTAVELRAASATLGFLDPLQIGITQGTLRTGAYGGQSRKSFSALGDEVNMAARLMTNAAPGEILISGAVHQAVEHDFVIEPRPPLTVKGKAEPLPVFAISAQRRRRAIRLQEPAYTLPMVGRQAELQSIEQKLALALTGQSQIIAIVAEPGMGKSRLVAEIIRAAHRQGFIGYGGSCQSDGIYSPYHAWKNIWTAFFGLDPELPTRKQLRLLEGELDDRAPTRVEALPLLSPLLDIDIPENDFTRGLEPKTRQSALHALLEDCLKSAARETPLLVVIEDLHWLDAVSQDLLEELAQALNNLPVCFVLAHRPPQAGLQRISHLESLPHYSRIELHELSQPECEQAIRAKLAQLYPARAGALPARLVEKLTLRSQGNPFYLEELLNYLRDRGLDPRDPADLEKIELPGSLHTLVLSRIDQLSEREKTTLRVASVIGRLFRADWLAGYYPSLGQVEHVKFDLERLRGLDITPLDTPEPELSYLFKHIVLHEVTYESLPFGLRSQLHEQLARFLERELAAGHLQEAALLDTLVTHYGRSENHTKQREYLRKAGEAAEKSFSNEAALAYYNQLLPLLSVPTEQIAILLQRGAVQQLLGHWDLAETDYLSALAVAQTGRLQATAADAQFALGRLFRLRGDFGQALAWLDQARACRSQLADRAGMGRIQVEIGTGYFQKSDYAHARTALEEGLALARETGDQPGTAMALNYLGNVAFSLGEYPAAETLLADGLALQRALKDKRGIAMSLISLGNLAVVQGDYATARTWLQECLALRRETGDKLAIAHALSSLGVLAISLDDYAAGMQYELESSSIKLEIGNRTGYITSLSNLGIAALALGQYPQAQSYFHDCAQLSEELGDHSTLGYAYLGLGMVTLVSGSLQTEGVDAVRELIGRSLRLRQEIGELLPLTSSLVGMALLAAQSGAARLSALLLGAVESGLKTIQTVMEPEMRAFHTQATTTARAVLGDPAYQSAWSEGEKLSLEQATTLALSTPSWPKANT